MVEIEDKTQEQIPQDEGAAPSTEADESGSSADEKLPFDEHPKWISARATEEKVESILDEHGYGSVDEMLEELVSSKSLQSEVGGRDIKKLVSAQEELDKIHAYWAEQEAMKKKEEDPDEYTKDLEKKLKT